MKKNLIFLTLLISVLMISVVSAGITGYAVSLKRGVAVLDDNLGTVSVREVSGDTATFQFTDPNTRKTEILSGTEGQTVTTSSGTQVEITGVTGGSLFRRGEVEVNVVPSAGGEEGGVGECSNYANSQTFIVNGNKVRLVIKEQDGVFYFVDANNGNPITDKFEIESQPKPFELYGVTITLGESDKTQVTICIGKPRITGHTHLSDAYVNTIQFDVDPAQTQAAYQTGNVLPLPDYFGNGKGEIMIYDNKWYDEISQTYKTTKFKQLNLKVVCNGYTKFDLAVGGMYVLGLDYADGVEYQVTAEGISNANPQAGGNTKGEYFLTIQEPFTDINGDFIDDEGIQKVAMEVTCARVEPTLHQFSQDY